MTSKRDPWIKFYFNDWSAEPRLKLVSRAARSLWLDMMGVMHQADPYGFLLVEGIAPSTAQLAQLVGDPERHVKAWLTELTRAGVPSVVGQDMPADVSLLIPHGLPGGTFLSRKMVRDAAKRARDKANGGKGGNPGLSGLTGGDNPKVHLPDNQEDNRRRRGGLSPRSQKPDTRKPPDPHSEPVIPPPALPCWEPHKDHALRIFGQKFCDFSLFVCALVPISDQEVALEAPSRFVLSRVSVESQSLHDLLGKTVKFRLAEGKAA